MVLFCVIVLSLTACGCSSTNSETVAEKEKADSWSKTLSRENDALRTRVGELQRKIRDREKQEAGDAEGLGLPVLQIVGEHIVTLVGPRTIKPNEQSSDNQFVVLGKALDQYPEIVVFLEDDPHFLQDKQHDKRKVQTLLGLKRCLAPDVRIHPIVCRRRTDVFGASYPARIVVLDEVADDSNAADDSNVSDELPVRSPVTQTELLDFLNSESQSASIAQVVIEMTTDRRVVITARRDNQSEEAAIRFDVGPLSNAVKERLRLLLASRTPSMKRTTVTANYHNDAVCADAVLMERLANWLSLLLNGPPSDGVGAAGAADLVT